MSFQHSDALFFLESCTFFFNYYIFKAKKLEQAKDLLKEAFDIPNNDSQIIPKEFPKNFKEFSKYFQIISKEFPKNSQRIPKESPKNPQIIPKESPENSQRIPKEFQKNSQDFENITHVNFPTLLRT